MYYNEKSKLCKMMNHIPWVPNLFFNFVWLSFLGN